MPNSTTNQNKQGTKIVAETANLSDLHTMLGTIKRHRTAQFLNEIVNHPTVFPWVCGRHDGPLDMTPVIRDENNVLLAGRHGALLFIQLQPGLYEVHSQCLPEGRGAWMVSFVQSCVHWIFTRTECFEMMTRCPKGNLGARALARAVGGKFVFTNPRGYTKGGKTISADIFSITIQDWMKTAPGLVERGHWFHERLEAEYKKFGRAEPPHDDDPVHDRYVGAACEMFLGNQAPKSCILYNRWARMADYAVINIVSMKPVAIDIADAILVIRENDFYVASLNQSNAETN